MVKVVKFIKSGSRLPGLSEQGNGELWIFYSFKILFWEDKKVPWMDSSDGQQRYCHKAVDIKMVQVVNFVSHIFYHNLKTHQTLACV